MRIDAEGLRTAREAFKDARPRPGLPFRITKLGHVVLKVKDLQRSAAFYTQVLGFRISDVYPETMMPGGMVFMRCNPDHHGVALVGAAKGDSEKVELHHLAFEVGTLDEVLRARDHLKARGVKIDFEGRRRAGCQVAVEFSDPDGHQLEIYWGLDQVGSGGEVRPPDEWREAFSLEEAIDDAPPGQDATLHDPTLRR
jgi:catechol 2,3-dioxygenase